MQSLTLLDIRVLYQRYVPRASRHPGERDRRAPLWWPAHEIGHLLTVPRRNIGVSMFGLELEINLPSNHAKRESLWAYELAAMSISRRLLIACRRPDLFFDPKIGELEGSDYDVMHFGSRTRARAILRRRGLLRLPHTRSGLETLCQRTLQDSHA